MIRHVLTAALALPLLTAADEPTPEFQRDGWKGFRAESICSAIYEDPKSPGAFVVLYRAADGRNVVGFEGGKVPEGWGGGRVELTSDKGETLVRRDFQNEPLPGIRVGVAVEDAEIAAITRAGAIVLSEKKKRLVTQSVTTPPSSWLSRCIREQKNVDPGSGLPVKTAAVAIGQVTLTADDYPSRSLRNEEQGRTIARLTVSAKGLVSGCEVAESSGYASLDEATCQVLSRQARYRPAKDKAGNPTQSTVTRPITWTIPE